VQLDPNEESEHILMKERELLMTRLQSNEKKMHLLRNAQVLSRNMTMVRTIMYGRKVFVKN